MDARMVLTSSYGANGSVMRRGIDLDVHLLVDGQLDPHGRAVPWSS
jgi:hypothetical protein